MFGRDKLGYASEHSVVDREKKVMTMTSKNVSNFSSSISLVRLLIWRWIQTLYLMRTETQNSTICNTINPKMYCKSNHIKLVRYDMNLSHTHWASLRHCVFKLSFDSAVRTTKYLTQAGRQASGRRTVALRPQMYSRSATESLTLLLCWNVLHFLSTALTLLPLKAR